MLIRNLLEPHDLRSIGLTVLRVVALYCAIVDVGCNLFGLLFVVMAGLARLAIAKTKIAIKLALFCHGVLSIHFCFLSALIELYIIYL